MFCGLFSTFDPVLFERFGSKWVVCFFFLVGFWPMWSKMGADIFVFFLLKLLWKEFKQLMTKPSLGFLLMGAVFLFFLAFNSMGLLPFFFAPSSHLSFNLSIGLPMWMGGIIYACKTSLEGLIAHCVPLGSPAFLWPLLVLVESVSLLIRPLTLAIRLMANVTAGHIIMNLIGGFFSSFLFLTPFGVVLVSGFILFEVGVAFVQAFVFMSLLSLYWEESEH
nr:ATP synthase F0 subunit 6 [Osculotes curta]